MTTAQKYVIGVGAGLVVLAIAVITIVNTTDTDGEPADHLALLAQPQQEEDHLPDEVGLGIDRSTTRNLGVSAGGAEHWAGIDENGEICIISRHPGPDWAIGWSCGPVDRFTMHGVGVYLASSNNATEAYLLPDGYEPTDAAAAHFDVVSPNLVTGDPDTWVVDKEALTFKATDGSGEIVLNDLSP